MVRTALRVSVVVPLLTCCQEPYYYCRVTDSTLVAPNSGSAALCERAATAEDVCELLMADPLWDTVVGIAGPYDSREDCEVAGPLDLFTPQSAWHRPPNGGLARPSHGTESMPDLTSLQLAARQR